VDDDRARALLKAERSRVEGLLAETSAAARNDRIAADQSGDMSDPSEPLVAEQGDDAVAASFRDRLTAIGRAEQRLDDGTYGLSVRSGLPIPDDRLEADPTAELTVEEAQEP
jgi:DnaK suppressor protein